MCLTNVYEKNCDKSGHGYKVFTRTKRGLISEIRGNLNTMRRGRWLCETKFRAMWFSDTHPLVSAKGEEYAFGWHIFLTKRGARKWLAYRSGVTIYRVKYKEGHTVGAQLGGKAIVAKYIKIMGKIA